MRRDCSSTHTIKILQMLAWNATALDNGPAHIRLPLIHHKGVDAHERP
jgi:hypothetical protein